MSSKKIKVVIVSENANSITTGIVNFLLANGHSARRINTTGIYDPVRGVYRKISKKSRGTADILSCINGRFVAFEVKYGRDTQSIDQVEYELEVTRAGGMYVVIETYQQFIDWYSLTGYFLIHS